MYSSGYSQVNSPAAQRKMQYRPKSKSCGYYMRIVFFFSSLIQSLIIVSLVLFLLYGNTQDTAVGNRVQDLEESFSRLSIENVALKQQRKNLTNLLNDTHTKKAHVEYDLRMLRQLSNVSVFVLQDYYRKLQICSAELSSCKGRCSFVPRVIAPPPFPAGCNCGLLGNQIRFVESNFTESVKKMRIDMEQIAKEKDTLVLENIHLRREKSTLEKELDLYKQKSKETLSNILSSVSIVSKALLEKIDSLFPRHIAFQLTCPKQRDHLEQIQTNCTKLSREVEDKLQGYLNSVGDQLSNMQDENYHLRAENWRLSVDYRDCSHNRTAIIDQNKQSSSELQKKHDQEKERLLMDKMKLNGEIEVLKSRDKYKTSEVDHLIERLKQLNISCMMKTGLGFSGGLVPRSGTPSQPGWGRFGGSSSSSSPSLNSMGVGSTGSGSSFSTGFGFNNPGTTGTGSSSSTFPQSGSSLGLGNTGLGFNKPGSNGTGSSSSTFPQSGSSLGLGSTGLGFNKPGTTGTGSSSSTFPQSGSSLSLGSTGLGFNKPGTTGTGSSRSTFPQSGSSSSLSNTGSGSSKPASTGGALSSFGIGSTIGSSGTGLNKPAESGRSSTGSTGSSKSGSTSSGFPWPWSSGSILEQSKTESAPGKTSIGSSYGGTGSYGGGKTSGSASEAGGIAQHIQELQRLINPPATQNKQDLSRMLG